MAKDLYDFANNDYYKKMIIYEGMMGGFFSVKSFFAAFGAIFLVMLSLKAINHCPDFSHLNHFSANHIFWSLVFGLYILLSGTYFLFRSFKPLYYQYQSRFWKQVVADVEKIYISNIEMCGAATGCGNFYSPKVSYSFSIDSQKYYGDKLSFEIPRFEYDLVSGTGTEYNKVNADFSNWLKTQKVSVYYNPKNPDESVVYRKLSVLSSLIYMITFTAFSFSFGVILSQTFYCAIFN